jgi:hypothetical protein
MEIYMMNPISASVNFSLPAQGQYDWKSRSDFLSLAGDPRSDIAQIKEVEISDSTLNSISIEKNALAAALLDQVKFARKLQRMRPATQQLDAFDISYLSKTFDGKLGQYHFKARTSPGKVDNPGERTYSFNIKGSQQEFNIGLYGVLSDTYVELIMKALDSDGDGKITWQEYRDYKPL